MSFKGYCYIPAEEYCIKVTDGTHDSPKKREQGYYLITSKHIKGRNINFDSAYLISGEDYTKINQRSKVDKWDVLISMIGEYCGFCYVERNSKINYAVKNVGIFKTGSKEKAEWIYYYLNSPEGKNVLASYRSGTSQPYISLGSLRKLPILLLENPQEMKSIINILSSIDNKIEVNNQVNKTLEDMAQAIFKHWFVDYEFPNEDGEPYKSSGGEMVESELGMIPKGWEVKELGDIITFRKGKKPKKIIDSYFERSKKYLTIDVLNRNSIQYGSIEKTILADEFDTLMVMDGARSGSTYYGQHGIVASTFAKVEIEDIKLNKDLIHYVIKNYEGDIKSNLTGSAIPHTDKEYVYRIKIAIPQNLNVLNEFSMIANKLRQLIVNKDKESFELSSVRDTLLPKLMSGEIRVPLDN